MESYNTEVVVLLIIIIISLSLRIFRTKSQNLDNKIGQDLIEIAFASASLLLGVKLLAKCATNSIGSCLTKDEVFMLAIAALIQIVSSIQVMQEDYRFIIGKLASLRNRPQK